MVAARLAEAHGARNRPEPATDTTALLFGAISIHELGQAIELLGCDAQRIARMIADGGHHFAVQIIDDPVCFPLDLFCGFAELGVQPAAKILEPGVLAGIVLWVHGFVLPS